jgi:hypothetical protein
MLNVTEEQWLVGGEPLPLLEHLRPRASVRKLRFFACACVRQVWDALIDEVSQQSVELAERYADGLVSREELAQVHERALEVARLADLRATASDPCWAASRAAARVSAADADLLRTATGVAFIASLSAAPWDFDAYTGNVTHHGDPQAKARVRRAQCDLLREVFGNPFRPVSFDPAWRSWEGGAVPQLAEEIHLNRNFDELPILADALEDAGCRVQAVLEHLRDGGAHVPGCWVLELAMGKL